MQLGFHVLVRRLVGVGGAQCVGRDHALEDVDLALMREVVMHCGVVGRRRLDHAREKRGLRRREVLRVLVEVGFRGRANAVRAVPKIDAVEVHPQDLVFGISLLQRDGEDHLLEFSGYRSLRSEQLDLDQLLRDGAATLVDPARRDVDPCGAGDRQRIDRAVVVEVAILRRQYGFRRVWAHLLDAQGEVVMAGRAPVLDQLAVAVEHSHVARRKHVLARVGKVLDRPQHVKGGGEEEHADGGCDPGLLGPQPRDRSCPESTLAAVSCRSGSHPSRSSSERSDGGYLAAFERYVRSTPSGFALPEKPV